MFWSRGGEDLAGERGGLADLVVIALVDADDEGVVGLDAAKGGFHVFADEFGGVDGATGGEDFVGEAGFFRLRMVSSILGRSEGR